MEAVKNASATGAGDLSIPLNDTATLNATGAVGPAFEEPDPEEIQHTIIAFYIVLFVMFGAQAGLVSWRKRHKRSYDLATLVGLWLIPPIISAQLGCWRFVGSWVVYSTVTGYYLYRCSARQLDKSLPKQVYAWFMVVFRVSVGVGFVGYIMLILEFTGLGLLFRGVLGPGAALTAVWYGLYYGILTRDSAEVATDRIARSLGAGRKMSVSVRTCGICGGDLNDAGAMAGGGSAASGGLGTVQLSCKHIFHLECIRGWCIIGKKDTCPTCWEKVDLRSAFGNRPWETTNLSWIQMLDMVRYLVVWNPIIFLGLHFIFHWTGLDHPPEHHGHHHLANGTAINGTAINGTMAALNATAGLAANVTAAAANATAAAVNATAGAVAQALR